MAEAPKLTPTEELVMDVLAARFRTGERLWAFGSGATRAVLRLEQLGYVQSMHGITDHTIRASLTGAGRAAWLSTSWVPALDTPDRSEVVTLLRTRCDELDATVRALPADARSAVKVLGLWPGGQLDRYSAAALLGLDPKAAESP